MNELPRLRSGLATRIIQDDIDNNSLELMVALLVLMSGANLAVGVQVGSQRCPALLARTLILCVEAVPRSDSP